MAEDWRRTSWVMSLSARSSIFWNLRRQSSGESDGGASKTEVLSCRTFLAVGASSGWMSGSKSLARMYSHFAGSVGCPCRPVLFWKPSRFAQEFLRSEQDGAVVRVAQDTLPGKTGRNSSDLTQEARPVDLVERGLQDRGQEVPPIVAFWSHRLMAWTMASQPFVIPSFSSPGRRYGVMVPSKVFAVRQRKLSPTASGRCPPSFFSDAEREALAVQETVGLGMLPPAMVHTTTWRARTSSFRQPGRRAPLMCGKKRPDGPVEGPGEGDWSYREELPSGHVFDSSLQVAVSHLLGDCLGGGSWGFVEQEGASLGNPSFAKVVARSSLRWKSFASS